MAGLSRQSIGAMHNTAIGDNAIPYACPQGQHADIVHAQFLSTAQMAFSQGGNIGVVFKEDRNIQTLFERLPEIEAIPSRQIWWLMETS